MGGCFLRIIRRTFIHLRLRPIRVFLFHQVSDEFDKSTMNRSDWTKTDQFKKNIILLAKTYQFIPLDLAHKKLHRDFIRLKKYAVLTSDDGWASLGNILPWLKEQGIPVTLFLNPGYFDGRHFREKETERYLLQIDIENLSKAYPGVSIASHGWEHIRATYQDEESFQKSVLDSIKALKVFPNFIPFFAYTYGCSTAHTDEILKENGMTPVAIDGEKNWNDSSIIHRELLDGVIL